MQAEKFNKLNKLRKTDYYKNEDEEAFLEKVNYVLQKEEWASYKDVSLKYPNIFVFGLPRSGTTIMSQFLIYAFRLGYINNFMARFWLAPLTGIKLSKKILGEKQNTTFTSDYAKTMNLYDIHEFGYFWRYWLKITSINDAIKIEERERNISWEQLRMILSNIQYEFNKPLCMKNIFGAYHMQKFIKEVPLIFWIYIQRDPFDVGISILNARKKFYGNPNLWWSTAPPEYKKLYGLEYIEQIAGQVYYLKKFYENQINQINPKLVYKANYESICREPEKNVKAIREKIHKAYNFNLDLREVPKNLTYREHKVDSEEKEKLYNALKQYKLV